MPRREDLKSVLVIGSGPIVIGQGCEFDYSGTQACRVLKQEGIRVSLVNSNPATIMTDPEFADATYVEPITTEVLAKVIAKERPDALLPTLGGQTALNAAVALHTKRHAQEVRCRADRRRHRRDRGLRGPREVQGHRHRARRRGAALGHLPQHRRVPQGRLRHRERRPGAARREATAASASPSSSAPRSPSAASAPASPTTRPTCAGSPAPAWTPAQRPRCSSRSRSSAGRSSSSS